MFKTGWYLKSGIYRYVFGQTTFGIIKWMSRRDMEEQSLGRHGEYRFSMPNDYGWFTNALYIGDKMVPNWAENEIRNQQNRQLTLF